MNRHWVIGLGLALAPALALAEAPGSGSRGQKQQQPSGQQGMQGDQQGMQGDQQQGHTASALSLPPGSKLVGVEEVDEIREFPESQNGKGGKGHGEIKKVMGVTALDSVFQTRQPYDKTVSFFDQQLKNAGFTALTKVVLPSATTWVATTPDGKPLSLIVRNTQPTTFETIEATAAAAEIHHNQ